MDQFHGYRKELHSFAAACKIIIINNNNSYNNTNELKIKM